MTMKLPDCHMQEESRFGDPLSLFLHKSETLHEIMDLLSVQQRAVGSSLP